MGDATIGIITYKRPFWLKRLLYSLGGQQVPACFDIDILVVDNGLDQQTKEIVLNFSANSPFKVAYATEAEPGIVAARNRCVEIFLQSESKNLFFIDDDEWPKQSDWVATMLKKKELYSADIVTSNVISVGESCTPQWAVDLIYKNSRYKEGDIVKIFYTNNLLLSRRVLEEVIPAFDMRFALTGASDYHFALKCTKKGFKAVHVDAPVEEEFPRSRATIQWYARRGFRSGVGFTRAHMFEENVAVAALRSCIMSNVRLARGIFYLLIGCASFDMLKIVDGIFRISSATGTIAGLIGIKYNEYKVIHGK